MSRPARPSPRGAERGSITPFAVIVAVALLFLAALVVDGSRQLSARARAIAYAEEAARTGAQKINLDLGFVQLLRADAEAAVDQYCAAARAADDRVQACETTAFVANTDRGSVATITVEVTVEFDPIMLDLFLWDSDGQVLVTGDGTAHPIEGITEPALEGFTPPPPVVNTDLVEPGLPTNTTGQPVEVPSATPSESCPSDDGEGDGGDGDDGGGKPGKPDKPKESEKPCENSSPAPD